MSYSPDLGTPVTNTRLRTPRHTTDVSGMCSVCTADCVGPCEIGLSAVRGVEALSPYAADKNQFASEKSYPVDFSCFNINGRVFGAKGLEADADLATYPNVDLSSSFGLGSKVSINAPFILPAMAKLAWREYFAGAALFGVPVVIGEDVIAKDPGLELENNLVVNSPLIAEMVDSFRRYQHGFGDVVLQANFDDESHGVLEYAIGRLGVKSVELKFGQAAKGIQGYGTVADRQAALDFKQKGYLVFPDPASPEVEEACSRGEEPVFTRIGKLPMWTPEHLVKRVAELRELGAERVCFKTGPFDPRDLALILEIASEAGVDLVTFDGAGGGTGSSPVKMMNEWGMPTVDLEVFVCKILKRMVVTGQAMPQVAVAGGFATEDHVFKGLALGAKLVNLIAIGRGAMAAAMAGKQVGEALEAGSVPKEYARFGTGKKEVFADYNELKALYGEEIDNIPTGAIGVYSYLKRVAFGLRQLMALNRKFAIKHIEQSDIVPLTKAAAELTGLANYEELLGV